VDPAANPMNEAPASPPAAWSIEPALLARLYELCGAARFDFSPHDLAAILEDVCARCLRTSAPADARTLLESLHIEELVLARACAAGNDFAWDLFLTRYRAKLYDAGAAIARDESIGHELAGSLYADLYGTRVDASGHRVSKLLSYSGRGSLDGWLRTLLAQEYVNRYRAGRRIVSLEEREEAGQQFASGAAADPALAPAGGPAREALEAAADETLRELPAEDRLILASHYLDGATLARIGRMLGVHESTISRRIDRAVAGLRKRLLARLRQKGLSARQAEEALESDVRDLNVDVRIALQERSS
jgi:RNA polymerase sigma-70 factor (ECF subfamily)